jgi:hypothetical protein
MRRTLLLIVWHFGLLAGDRLFGDVVTLVNGRQISGSVESGNTQELHIKAGISRRPSTSMTFRPSNSAFSCLRRQPPRLHPKRQLRYPQGSNLRRPNPTAYSSTPHARRRQVVVYRRHRHALPGE